MCGCGSRTSSDATLLHLLPVCATAVLVLQHCQVKADARANKALAKMAAAALATQACVQVQPYILCNITLPSVNLKTVCVVADLTCPLKQCSSSGKTCERWSLHPKLQRRLQLLHSPALVLRSISSLSGHMAHAWGFCQGGTSAIQAVLVRSTDAEAQPCIRHNHTVYQPSAWRCAYRLRVRVTPH